jgi:hypothetical protein
MKKFLIEQEPPLHFLLIFTSLVKPGNEDRCVLTSFEQIFSYQLYNEIYFIPVLTHQVNIFIIYNLLNEQEVKL